MVIRPSGGLSEADPPVPIPNTEVKRFSADDTALATVWENRSLPGGLFLFPRSSAPIGDSSHFPVKFNPLAGLSDVLGTRQNPALWVVCIDFPLCYNEFSVRRKETWLLRVPGEVARPPRYDALPLV